jgi:hypothetical protein
MNLSVTAIHMLGDTLDAQDCLRYTVYRTSIYIYYYSNKNVEIAGNFASAHGHFDNLCLISADKIETLEDKKTESC